MIKFELVKDAPKDTKKPKRGTSGSAGYDFYAPCDILVPAESFSELVFFNIKAYMPKNMYLGITVRSSMATTTPERAKNGKSESTIVVAQGTAIIDSDYADNPDNDGNIGIMFYNRSKKDRVILKGERCCQGIFMEYFVTDDDESVEERKGGYGHSGRF